MGNVISERIKKIQKLMIDESVHYLYVPLCDFHGSEYVGEYFKEAEFLTGFTGSNATVIVTLNKAYMWTDGRYFIQAEKELKDTGIVLMKMGDNVPSPVKFLEENVKPNEYIGFNSKYVDYNTCKKMLAFHEKFIDIDLVGEIWDERPDISKEKIYKFDEEFSGENSISKIKKIKDTLYDNDCDFIVVSDLCDIAWILNLRGNDIKYVPVFMSYLVVSKDKTILYCNVDSLDMKALEYLREMDIVLSYYDMIYADLENEAFYTGYKKCWIEPSTTNIQIYASLIKYVDVITKNSFIKEFKAVKNTKEISNTKKAHLKDAIAMIKFMYKLKTSDISSWSEIYVCELLYELRSEDELFLEESFETIAGLGSNGAIVHYAVTNESNKEFAGEKDTFLLVDSGGHYLTGTTDITRTFLIGKASDKMKEMYTLVLKSNLRLANAKFKQGVVGENLDVLARGPLWENGLDFNHGTGHGVGHVLSVHEGPNVFRSRFIPEYNCCVLKPNMITTDEPGLYFENEYGIRLENELLCVEDYKNENGIFLKFDVLTLVPFDMDVIEFNILTDEEKRWLEEYHNKVYDEVSSHLQEEELIWLRDFLKVK